MLGRVHLIVMLIMKLNIYNSTAFYNSTNTKFPADDV